MARSASASACMRRASSLSRTLGVLGPSEPPLAFTDLSGFRMVWVKGSLAARGVDSRELSWDDGRDQSSTSFSSALSPRSRVRVPRRPSWTSADGSLQSSQQTVGSGDEAAHLTASGTFGFATATTTALLCDPHRRIKCGNLRVA